MHFKNWVNLLPVGAIAIIGIVIWHQNQKPVPQNTSTTSLERWQVVNVHDGDTITVQRGSQREKIRFACIDAV